MALTAASCCCWLLLLGAEAAQPCGSRIKFEPRNPAAYCSDGKFSDALPRCAWKCTLEPLCRGIRLIDNGGGGGGDCVLLSSEQEVSAAAQAATATDCSGDRLFAWMQEQLQQRGCSQSSINYGGSCERGIDGSTRQEYTAGASCSHTDKSAGTNQWWQAVAASKAFISLVRIYNRQDCCAERLRNFEISLDGQQCASYNSSQSFSVKDFPCERVGVTLRITQRLVGEHLTLCEVIAFGRLL